MGQTHHHALRKIFLLTEYHFRLQISTTLLMVSEVFLKLSALGNFSVMVHLQVFSEKQNRDLISIWMKILRRLLLHLSCLVGMWFLCFWGALCFSSLAERQKNSCSGQEVSNATIFIQAETNSQKSSMEYCSMQYLERWNEEKLKLDDIEQKIECVWLKWCRTCPELGYVLQQNYLVLFLCIQFVVHLGKLQGALWYPW